MLANRKNCKKNKWMNNEEIEQLHKWWVTRFNSNQNPFNKQKSSTNLLHWQILPNIQRPINSNPVRLFQKLPEKGTLPNSLNETIITAKPDKEFQSPKENHMPISLVKIDAKIYKKTLAV